jgi:hypothetical protein
MWARRSARPTVWALIILAGCQSATPNERAGVGCVELATQMNLSDRILTLNLLSAAFSQGCYGTVIDYGAKAHSEFRHKTFSVLKETASMFIPDGTLTDYVLESYERGYLSFLLAASYFKTHKADAAKVELRQLDHELFTPLYNYGEDPINLVLSAVLWEQLGEPGEARVDWLRLRDQAGALRDLTANLRTFAEFQMDRIDSAQAIQPGWRIYGIGRFPQVDWNLEFLGSSNGYFRVSPKRGFVPACVSETGARISTRNWFQKVATRHNHAYHPLLNMQSWIRLPVGIIYGLVPMTAGAGVVVGGCVADAMLSEGRGGALCQLSIVGGVALMAKGPDVIKGTLQPDLRHWERIPEAFVVTWVADPVQEPCLSGMHGAQRMI